jgi:hypothetical protein
MIRLICILLFVSVLCLPVCSKAYSVLTHEAIIDICWDKTIQPLLLKKYPGSTAEELRDAHAYAYGGAVAPDMGYYPFGSKLFTRLVHYVRTGDFVNALLDESTNINEYAFSIGVLCHYNADKFGHPIGTNRCVPLVYPQDKEKYGTHVTYEQDPIGHIRMEFGFDILQTARGTYAPKKYNDYIGFKISRPVLERAFLKTYGLDINDIFTDFSLAAETFRWVIKNLFPTVTRAAWAGKKKEIVKANPGMTRRKFEYKMRRANYYREFGKRHERPGFFPGVLAVVVKVMPKVGPLRALRIRIPGPEAEKIFIRSFDTVQVHFTIALKKLNTSDISLDNIDYDTGHDTSPGEYILADETYSDLLLKLSAKNFTNVDAALRKNIVWFYGSCNTSIAAMAGREKWEQMTVALDSLNAARLPVQMQKL